MEQIATFHTHLGALRFQRKLTRLGYDAALAPVPRKLSASCGTCVRFSASFEEGWADEDLDSVFLTGQNGYERIFHNE
jgi:hypothetical protein